jgi:hypothetical protein
MGIARPALESLAEKISKNYCDRLDVVALLSNFRMRSTSGYEFLAK